MNQVLPRLLLAILLVALVPVQAHVRADTVGTFRDRLGTVRLMSQPCAGGPTRAKLAIAASRHGQRTGCWSVDANGNPIVRWRDGRRQKLDGNRVRLAPKYAALLEGTAPSPAGVDFPRPSWCPRARFPHERLICQDRELAARDLRLAPLWRDFKQQRRLTAAQQAWHKSDFFSRQKACGADKACIAREQSAQVARYEDALR
jgi:hypothetical protein